MSAKGPHPVMAWPAEHAVDILSMYAVGRDARTGYERMNGNTCSHDMVEFREHVHHRYPKSSRRKEENMEGKSEEGHVWESTGELGRLLVAEETDGGELPRLG